MRTHPELAKSFVQDKERMLWHDKAIWYVREKRDTASKSIEEWEELRNLASKIKEHTISKLDHYLEEFEQNAIKNGVSVHWAKDAKEHNEIVYEILKSNSATKVVKSKSMLTEECGLNPYLESRGIEVVDTDLGERIIQLKGDAPSHIVLPAIHLKKEQVAQIFHEHLGSQENNSDPTYLTNIAREDLKKRFINADAAITGVNFAVAQNGMVVVCTNEGNADMGTSHAPLHIASMGIEKIIPRVSDLGVFTRLLARSATGQPITAFTSCYKSPREGAKMHIIIVDNGRSKIVQDSSFGKSLHCIRCGACLNTCPVYRRSGGASYRYVIPGPIGSTLGAIRDSKTYSDLPFACTLCASCTDVCPSKIDLHSQLYHHRQNILKSQEFSKKRLLLKSVAWMMRYPLLMDMFSKILRITPKTLLNSKRNIWTRYHTLPKIPKQNFKELYKRHKNGK